MAGAAIGLGSHVYASKNNKEAIKINNEANSIFEESSRSMEVAKGKCADSMSNLAQLKIEIMRGNLKRFVKYFSKIKAVNFTDVGESYDLTILNRNELSMMQSMISSFEKSSKNEIVSGLSGVALAVGAADVLAGGTILGGAAGLSVGSFAGGAALGVIAAPVFAITGIFSASEASANLEKASSNLTKAHTYKEECDTYILLADSVSDRCDLFYETLYVVNTNMFNQAVNNLELIVKSKRTFGDFFKNLIGQKIYTNQEMQSVMATASLAKMIKTIIEANILDKGGKVSESSGKLIEDIKYKIKSDNVQRMKKKQKVGMLTGQQTQIYTSPIEMASPNQNLWEQRYYQASLPLQNDSIYSNTYSQNASIAGNNVQVINQQTCQAGSDKGYKPHILTQIFMWICVVWWCILGFGFLFLSEFITAMFLMASGLIMCPQIKKDLRFWIKFLLSFVFLVISVIVSYVIYS